MWLINYAVVVMCEQYIKRFSGFSASASTRWGGAWGGESKACPERCRRGSAVDFFCYSSCSFFSSYHGFSAFP
jgi:hypothetical protein